LLSSGNILTAPEEESASRAVSVAYDGCMPMPAASSAPTPADLHKLEALSRARDYVELERRARALIERHPTWAPAWKALGESLHAQGKDPLPALERAALLLPNDPEVHSNLGTALRLRGDLPQAIAAFRHALDLAPQFAVLHGNLGLALLQQGQLPESVASFRRALELNPALADVHNNLGSALYALGDLAAAVDSYRRALDYRPTHADAYSNLGSVLMQLGQIDDAERCLSKSIELAPDDPKALAAALLFIPYRADDARFARLETLYEKRQSLSTANRIRLGFSMGRAMEGIGLYDRAFAAYEEANRLVHREQPFDEAADEQHLDNVARLFTRQFIADWRGDASANDAPADRDSAGSNMPIPIFIVGMPRSGSSLIEQMLATHPAIHGAGELTLIGELAGQTRQLSLEAGARDETRAALAAMGRRYLQRLRDVAAGAAGARYVTDKMPANYQHLGLIALMLPQARIIHCEREPLDTCMSCYALRFTSGHEYSYDLELLGRQYVRYQRLMAHWRRVIPAGTLIDVRYEHTVQDPEREMRRVFTALEVPWDDSVLNFHTTDRAVKTASAAQVRKPMYANAIGRASHFAKGLGPLRAILARGGSIPS
jgi:tetratricopeptide (TPR) repeat protein